MYRGKAAELFPLGRCEATGAHQGHLRLIVMRGGGREEDWRRTGGGREEDWRRTGGGRQEDGRRTGGGREEDWRRTGGGREEDGRRKAPELLHPHTLTPRCV